MQNGSKGDCGHCTPVSGLNGTTSSHSPELFASFPNANSPDQSGPVETSVDGGGGNRMGLDGIQWDFGGTVGDGGGVKEQVGIVCPSLLSFSIL